MKRVHVGIVTAWAECGMGHIARNWIHTLNKYPDSVQYQIFSRANPWISGLRWHGPDIIEGPESMDIDTPVFWNWIEDFKPDILIFQDQNTYGKTGMRGESGRLRKKGIKLINYPDWILKKDLPLYRGLYDVNIAHVKRNFDILSAAGADNPVYIKWGVILSHFPFKQRRVPDKIRFYINLGHGCRRKGYTFIPKALEKIKGPWPGRLFFPNKPEYRFIASAVENTRDRVKPSFIKYCLKNRKCEFS